MAKIQLKHIKIEVTSKGSKEAQGELEKLESTINSINTASVNANKGLSSILATLKEIAPTMNEVMSSAKGLGKALNGATATSGKQMSGYADNLLVVTEYIREVGVAANSSANSIERLNNVTGLTSLIEILEDININTKETSKSTDRLTDHMRELRDSVDLGNDEFESFTHLTKEAQQKMEEAGVSAKKFNNDLRRLNGTGNQSTRSFSDLVFGMNPLVSTYASIAVNVYALTEAFRILSEAANLSRLEESTAAFSAAISGINVQGLAADLREVSEGALSVRDSLDVATRGISYQFTTDQLTDLTEGARKASIALGINFKDAIDRVTRGIAKQEIEVLDEVGVVTKLTTAFEKYVAGTDRAIDSLTEYERQTALANEVQRQLNEKFSGIETAATGWEKLAASTQNVVDSGLKAIAEQLEPAAKALAEVFDTIAPSVSKAALAQESFKIASEAIAKGDVVASIQSMAEGKEYLAEATKDTTAAVSPLVEGINNLAETAKTLVGVLEALTPLLIGLAAVKIVKSMIAFKNSVAESAIALATKEKETKKLIASLAVLSAQIGKVRTGFFLLGAAARFLTGPIGILVTLGATLFGSDLIDSVGNFFNKVEEGTPKVREATEELKALRDAQKELEVAKPPSFDFLTPSQSLKDAAAQYFDGDTIVANMKAVEEEAKKLDRAFAKVYGIPYSEEAAAEVKKWNLALQDIPKAVTDISTKLDSAKTPLEDMSSKLQGLQGFKLPDLLKDAAPPKSLSKAAQSFLDISKSFDYVGESNKELVDKVTAGISYIKEGGGDISNAWTVGGRSILLEAAPLMTAALQDIIDNVDKTISNVETLSLRLSEIGSNRSLTSIEKAQTTLKLLSKDLEVAIKGTGGEDTKVVKDLQNRIDATKQQIAALEKEKAVKTQLQAIDQATALTREVYSRDINSLASQEISLNIEAIKSKMQVADLNKDELKALADSLLLEEFRLQTTLAKEASERRTAELIKEQATFSGVEDAKQVELQGAMKFAKTEKERNRIQSEILQSRIEGVKQEIKLNKDRNDLTDIEKSINQNNLEISLRRLETERELNTTTESTLAKYRDISNTFSEMSSNMSGIGAGGEVFQALSTLTQDIGNFMSQAGDDAGLGDYFSNALSSWENFNDLAGPLMQATSALFQSLSESKVTAIDAEIEAEKARDGQSKESLAKLKALEAKKIKEQSKAKKAQVGMSTALAIMNAMTLPWPLNLAAAGLAAAMGAMQISNIDKAASGQLASLGGSTPDKMSITGGSRENNINIDRSATAGERSYTLGEAGSGTASNFTPGRAIGGTSSAPMLVGERGPEIISPVEPVTVTPTGESSSRPNVTFAPQFHISTIDSNGMQGFMDQYSEELYQGLEKAMNTKGKTLDNV